jgi:hypothetical protein
MTVQIGKFKLTYASDSVLFRIDTPIITSDMIYFDMRGAQLWGTTYPQSGVDYDYDNRLKITGVDEI